MLLQIAVSKISLNLGFAIKGHLVNGKIALEMAEEINPDLIIMDFTLQ